MLFKIVCVIVYLPSLASGFPEGFILRVFPHCGNGSADGTIEILADLAVSVTANCENGLVKFPIEDKAHSFLTISFNSNGSAPCIMTKRLGAEVYTALVVVGWGEAGSPIITDQEQYHVTCVFNGTGHKASVEKDAVPGLIAPKEMQNHEGPAATSVIDLEMDDVNGDVIVTDIDAGRWIQLKAISDGTDGELGLRPSSCDVVGVGTGERYAVLRAGCGDGVIFEKDEGFLTEGKTAYSPYFQSFHLLTDHNIKFDCNFTLCNITCDGSSCAIERRKRELSKDDENLNPEMSSTKVFQTRLRVRPVDDPSTRKNDGLAGTVDGSGLPWSVLVVAVPLLVVFCVVALMLSLYSFILLHRRFPLV